MKRQKLYGTRCYAMTGHTDTLAPNAPEQEGAENLVSTPLEQSLSELTKLKQALETSLQ